jgi:predicted NBD/HSP70 family sugar kinase
MRTVNRRVLWESLFAAKTATRPQLARDTGLSLPTVNAALSELEQVGLVRSAGRPETSQGRPAEVFETDDRVGFAVAVDVGRAWIRVALADLAGTVLCRANVRNGARTSSGMVDLITAGIDQTLREEEIEAGLVTHTVIGSPGVYDARKGRVLYAANLPGWQRTGLRKTLDGRLSGSLIIDNDANLAAIGEHTYGAGQGMRQFVYAHVGTGVGLGLILDGHLYNGFAGAAGEAGFLPIGDGSATAVGRPMRGSLEEHIAADAVVRYGREYGLKTSNAEAVFAAARANDPRGLAALQLEAAQLARLLVSVGALLDPELIVLGGAVGRNLDLLEEPIRRALSDLSPLKPTFAIGLLGDEAVLRGAVAIGVTKARLAVFEARTAALGH